MVEEEEAPVFKLVEIEVSGVSGAFIVGMDVRSSSSGGKYTFESLLLQGQEISCPMITTSPSAYTRVMIQLQPMREMKGVSESWEGVQQNALLENPGTGDKSDCCWGEMVLCWAATLRMCVCVCFLPIHSGHQVR